MKRAVPIGSALGAGGPHRMALPHDMQTAHRQLTYKHVHVLLHACGAMIEVEFKVCPFRAMQQA
jgi:hypothetical protein